MKAQMLMGAGLTAVALSIGLGGTALELTAQAQKAVLPVFEVDPRFPTMPDHTLLDRKSVV